MRLTMESDGAREPKRGDVVLAQSSTYVVAQAADTGETRWMNLQNGVLYTPGTVDGVVFRLAPRGTRVVLEV